MMNCMNCSNADSKMIASDVDSLQENKDAKLKYSRNDKKNVANIIDLLIKISTLNKEREEQKSFMKRDSIEADLMSSTRLRRKTSRESECIHREECTETEDINSTA